MREEAESEQSTYHTRAPAGRQSGVVIRLNYLRFGLNMMLGLIILKGNLDYFISDLAVIGKVFNVKTTTTQHNNT